MHSNIERIRSINLVIKLLEKERDLLAMEFVLPEYNDMEAIGEFTKIVGWAYAVKTLRLNYPYRSLQEWFDICRKFDR